MIEAAIAKRDKDVELDEEKELPGEALNVLVSGNEGVTARQVKGAIWIVRKKDGHALFRIPRAGAEIRSLWLSKSGEILAAGLQDGEITIWRSEFGGAPVLSLKAHVSEVSRLRASADEMLLLSADEVGRVRVWPLLSPPLLIERASRMTSKGSKTAADPG